MNYLSFIPNLIKQFKFLSIRFTLCFFIFSHHSIFSILSFFMFTFFSYSFFC